MCGIAGIVNARDAAPIPASDLQAMGDAQRHRGPDDRGAWISEDGSTAPTTGEMALTGGEATSAAST